MSKLDCDSESGDVLDCAAKRIKIDVSENEGDANSNIDLKSVERAVAQEIDSQHPTLPIAVDVITELLSANRELIESENM